MAWTHRLWNVLPSKTGKRKPKDIKYSSLRTTWVIRAVIAATTGNASPKEILLRSSKCIPPRFGRKRPGRLSVSARYGSRQWEGTIQYGLDQGHKFGIMASTDQHSGYPGSYGDGRIGVLAPSLTRDAIWGSSSYPPRMRRHR